MRFAHFAFSALLLAFFTGTSSLAASKACPAVLSPTAVTADRILADRDLSDLLLRFENLGAKKNDTTGKRKEDKFVVSRDSEKRLVQKMALEFGARLENRDKHDADKKNVTVTRYLPRISVTTPDGKALAAKVRFRRYFWADAHEPLASANLKATTNDSQYVEIKIDSAAAKDVVIKPRLLWLNSDVELLMDRELFQKNEAAIKERVRAKNPKEDARTVDLVFQVLNKIHSLNHEGHLPLFVEIAYVRESYVAHLVDQNQQPVDVQTTIDSEVMMRDLRTQKIVMPYGPNEVIELKVPLSRAKFTEQDLQEVSDFGKILEFREGLFKSHNSEFKQGSGKLSVFGSQRTESESSEFEE